MANIAACVLCGNRSEKRFTTTGTSAGEPGRLLLQSGRYKTATRGRLVVDGRYNGNDSMEEELKGVRVLVIDDSKTIRRSAENLLVNCRAIFVSLKIGRKVKSLWSF